jgi:signal transduction histidine kinase
LRLAAAATRSPGRSPAVARLPLLLWPLGAAAVAAGFYFLFDSGGDVTAVQVINRSVGGSFIACGLVAWQRRPENRTGMLMTLTGFLFLAEPLLIEVDSSGAYTLGQVVALWWAIPFTALILAFPNGRITSPIDAIIVSAFFVLEVIVQFIWVLFLPFPEGKTNVLQVRADADLAHTIDTWQRWCVVAVGMALVVVGVTRWLRAPAPLRRLLLPTLAGSIAVFVLIGLTAQRLLDDQSASRPTQTIAGIVMVLVPLAFVFGLLRAQLARAGMADLVVALQRTPEFGQLGDVLAQALRDPSLVLAYWLPRFGAYVDGDGQAVALPAEGSGRAATCIDHDGEHVAVLVHVAALAYEPELLEIVCAAADIALEQERLQAELKARADELVGSRARIVEAGDTARRRLERDLHDGAQQRLVSLAIALRRAESRIQADPQAAEQLVASAREELAQSLSELRELARGIHPAVLDQGLTIALDSLATRSTVPVSLAVDLTDRLPEPVETAAYFVASEALANVGKYAHASSVTITVSRHDGLAVIAVADDGVGGADDNLGSGLRGLADRVEALGGRLQVVSPSGSGTVLTAELPCGS